MNKQIKVQGVIYYIQDKADLVALAQKLVAQGYTIQEVAKIFGVTERTIQKYLQDCW